MTKSMSEIINELLPDFLEGTPLSKKEAILLQMIQMLSDGLDATSVDLSALQSKVEKESQPQPF